MLNILSKESGVLGISGISSDFRDLIKESNDGNERVRLAINSFVYKVRKYIEAYAATMNGVDVIVFTAGVGENSSEIREEICKELCFLGAELDTDKNNTRGSLSEISTESSKINIYVVPTDEELMIAQDTMELLSK